MTLCLAASFVGCGANVKTKLLTEDSEVTDSFWKTDQPESLGFDRQKLQKVVATTEKLSGFLALIVIRDGKIVVERYFNNSKPDDLFQIRSITKNFTSAMAGILIEEGQLSGVDAPISQFFDELKNSSEKDDVTVKHLLNMTSGLQWNEDREILPFAKNNNTAPIKSWFLKPLVEKPGDLVNYNSLSTHLVARILEIETGRGLEKNANEKLFQPLGIEAFDWERDSDGHCWGGYGLQLRARDLAKFGQLYLQNGKWHGKQVIPRAWVEQSRERQVEAAGRGYSYSWWHSDNPKYGSLFYGEGYGGQVLMIVPEKKLIVVAIQKCEIPLSLSTTQFSHISETIFPSIYEACLDEVSK